MSDISSSSMKRLLHFVDSLSLSDRKFSESVGLSHGVMNSVRKRGVALGVDKLEKILDIYEELNPVWLLTGKGSMIVRPDVGIPAITEPHSAYNENNCDEVRQENLRLIKENAELRGEVNGHRQWIDIIKPMVKAMNKKNKVGSQKKAG